MSQPTAQANDRERFVAAQSVVDLQEQLRAVRGRMRAAASGLRSASSLGSMSFDDRDRQSAQDDFDANSRLLSDLRAFERDLITRLNAILGPEVIL